MTTLKNALIAAGLPIPKRGKNVARTLLGKYKGLTPKGRLSTTLIKESRSTLYGKTK